MSEIPSPQPPDSPPGPDLWRWRFLRAVLGTFLGVLGVISWKTHHFSGLFFLVAMAYLLIPRGTWKQPSQFSLRQKASFVLYVFGFLLLLNRTPFFLPAWLLGWLLGGVDPLVWLKEAAVRRLTSFNPEFWVSLYSHFLILIGIFAFLGGCLRGLTMGLLFGLDDILPSWFLGLLCMGIGWGIRRRAFWAGACGLGLSCGFFLEYLNRAFVFTHGNIWLLPQGILVNSGPLIIFWAMFYGFYNLYFPQLSAMAEGWRAGMETNLQSLEADLQAAKSRLTQAENRMATTSRDLGEERVKFHFLFEALNEGVLLLDPAGLVLYMNPAMAGLLGLERQAWEGQEWKGMAALPGIAVVGRPSDASNPEPAGEGELECRNADGEVARRIAYYQKVVNSQCGKPLATMTFARDVTLEREIDRMKTDFVSSVSHELRTPLTSISAYSEMLLDEEVDDEATRLEYLQIILDEAERLSKLINNILDLSRIESGKQEYHFGRHSPCALAKKAVAICGSAADKKGQHLESVLPATEIRVVCDPDLLLQAMLNLVNNAVKYTPDGGRIVVEAVEDGDCWEFRVRDNGIGISPEDQKKLFLRFFRVEGGAGRKISGTGLGLALVKHIVQVHSGEVHVESALGKGSTFSFRLPKEFPFTEATEAADVTKAIEAVGAGETPATSAASRTAVTTETPQEARP